MVTENPANSTPENRVSCSCKSTCSTKRANNSASNRGCLCKTEGLHCGPLCTCGSAARPCRNKPGSSNNSTAARPARQRPTQPYNPGTDRPTEEQERIAENNKVKEIIDTLDEPMVQRLCIRSLRRGIGSMDCIHSLLIMEDDLDEDAPDSTTPEQTSLEEELEVEPEPGPSRSTDSLLPWCKCGFCQVMPQEIENKCCEHCDIHASCRYLILEHTFLTQP